MEKAAVNKYGVKKIPSISVLYFYKQFSGSLLLKISVNSQENTYVGDSLSIRL